VNAGNVPVVERFITTYKTNAAGADDPSYLDVETLFTLQYIRWDWRNHVLRKFPRHKLADDGTRFGAGQTVVTPKIMKAEAIAKFADWELAGLVEGREQFKRDLIVERNVSDRNRLDMLLPTDLVNQFRVAGVKIGFIL
jgi:phage tail sheath gpL-like